MVNTYNNAGLAIQTNGENNNTWGDFTNTNENITSLRTTGFLSQAITSGDVTLPNVDGVADDGKNTLIKTTGVLTGNRALIVPTVSARYTVWNANTGNFTMTVKTAAGTGIVVPQGKVMNLFCDGTNILEEVTAVGSLLVNGPTTGSVQTVASSGTSQSVNVSTASLYQITLNNNCTITLSGAAPSGVQSFVRVLLIQDGTGGHSVTFAGGTFKWLGQADQSTAPTFTTTAGYYSEVVFRTNDGGTTWTGELVGSGSSSGGGVTPTNGVYIAVGSNGKLSSSTDGVTWTLQATQFGGSNIVNAFSNNGRLHFNRSTASLATTSVRYTTDGTTFTAWGGTPSGDYSLTSFGVTSNGNILPTRALEITGNLKWLFTSDNGTDLKNTSNIGLAPNVTHLAAINGSDVLLVRTTLGPSGSEFITSTTSGQTYNGFSSRTWSSGTNPNLITFVGFSGGIYLIGTSDGRIGSTTLLGTSVTVQFTFSTATQVNKIINTGTKWVAVSQSGKLANATSINAWTERVTGLSGNIVDIANSGSTVVCVTDAGEIARSADNGDTWVVLTVPTNNPFGGGALQFVKFRLTQFWAGGAGGKLGASSDGSSFSLVSSGFGTDTIFSFEAI